MAFASNLGRQASPSSSSQSILLNLFSAATYGPSLRMSVHERESRQLQCGQSHGFERVLLMSKLATKRLNAAGKKSFFFSVFNFGTPFFALGSLMIR